MRTLSSSIASYHAVQTLNPSYHTLLTSVLTSVPASVLRYSLIDRASHQLQSPATPLPVPQSLRDNPFQTFPSAGQGLPIQSSSGPAKTPCGMWRAGRTPIGGSPGVTMCRSVAHQEHMSHSVKTLLGRSQSSWRRVNLTESPDV